MSEPAPTMAMVMRACQRAVRFRRQQAGPLPPGMEIEALPYLPPFRCDPDGWAMVGTIADGSVPAILEVWWHDDADRVRVQKPPTWPEPRTPDLAPLRCVIDEPRGIDSKPYVALPGYIFNHDGIDYDADATERLTALQGSMDGWTWRLLTP